MSTSRGTSRGVKRKRYSDIKNMLVNDLHKLMGDSGDFNNDLNDANEDFVSFFKSMEDRQSVLLTRALLIEEKYKEITSIVRDGPDARVTVPPTENVELPPPYANDVYRYIGDSTESLSGHAKALKEHVKEITGVFAEYVEKWNNKLKDMEELREKIDKARLEMDVQLQDYKLNIN